MIDARPAGETLQIFLKRLAWPRQSFIPFLLVSKKTDVGT